MHHLEYNIIDCLQILRLFHKTVKFNTRKARNVWLRSNPCQNRKS